MSQGKEAAAAGNRRRLLALFAAVAAVLIVLVTIALYSMHRLDAIVSANLARIDALTAMVDDARVAQVAFKTQVQEWKNTLLRGHNAQDFDRYHKAFLEQRKLVQARFAALAAEAKALDLPADEVGRLDALTNGASGPGRGL
jgi:methyl-accepting chemotaxis protein